VHYNQHDGIVFCSGTRDGTSRFQGRRKSAVLALFVKFGNPFIWAQRIICPFELFARCKILSFGSDTFEVICIILEAISGLVGVGKAGIEADSLQYKTTLPSGSGFRHDFS